MITRKLFSLFLLILVSVNVMAQSFFSEGTKAGLKDNAGRVVLQPVFDNYWNFTEGTAAVQHSNKWGYIDQAGRVTLAFSYEYATPFFEGAAVVKLGDNKWAVINKTGGVVAQLPYEEVGNFVFGFARVLNDKKYGFIDKTGKEVIAPGYDGAENFSREGLAAVCREKKWGFIDKANKEVIPFDYGNAGEFSEGLAPVMKNQKWGYIDSSGKEIIPINLAYRKAYPFKNEKAEVAGSISRGAELRGLIDKSGKLISRPMFHTIGSFSDDGFAVFGVLKYKVIEESMLYQLSKTDYKIETPHIPSGSGITNDGVITDSGKIIIPAKYFFIQRLSDGTFEVVDFNFKAAYFDSTGKKTAMPALINTAQAEKTGLYRYLAGGKWGYKDVQGEIIVKAKYDFAFDFNDGVARVISKNRSTIIDAAGKELIPINYRNVFARRLNVNSNLVVITAYVGDNSTWIGGSYHPNLVPIFRYGLYDLSQGKEIIPLQTKVLSFTVDLSEMEFQSLVQKEWIVAATSKWTAAFVNYWKHSRGVIDYYGKEIIPLKYEIFDAMVFAPNERILVGEVTDRKYKNAFSVDNYQITEAKYGVIDYSGKEIIPLAVCTGIALLPNRTFEVSFKDGSKKTYDLNGQPR